MIERPKIDAKMSLVVIILLYLPRNCLKAVRKDKKNYHKLKSDKNKLKLIHNDF